MPTMLGLTTDPSPHGIQGQSHSRGKRRGQNSNGDMQLATRGSTSLTPHIDSSNFFDRAQQESQKKDDDDDEEEGKLNTIRSRNHAAAKEMETLLWRALCDKPKSAAKYIGKDAIMSNRFLFGDSEPRTKDSEPTLQEALKDCEEWLAYKMHDPQIVEIDLMAVAISYRLTLFRQVDQGNGKYGLETVEATASSSWRQLASGDWELCSSMAA